MNGRLVSRGQLGAGELAEMFELFGRHFQQVSERRFREDLDDKNWVVWLTDDRGGLVGFSTLLLYRTHHEGEPLTIVYSGDTIVDPRAWRSPVLAKTWIDSVRSLHRAFGQGRLFWLLITSGFRTYRFLPTFWREFFPRHDRPTPGGVQHMIDHLAHHRFGCRYDPRTGVVRFAQPQVLSAILGGIPAARMRNPHAAFFARANPGHTEGDELVCLAELADHNLTPAGRRMVPAGRRSGLGEAAAS